MAKISNKNIRIIKNPVKNEQDSKETKKPVTGSSVIVSKSKIVSKSRNIKSVKLAQKPASAAGTSGEVNGRFTAYLQQKKAKKKKSLFFTVAFIAFVVLFFSFGFIARPIFGADAEITRIAEDNIGAVIDIVSLVENYIDVIIKSLSTILISLIIIIILLMITRAIGAGGNRRKTIASLVGSFIKYIGAIVMFMIVLSTLGVDTGTLLASVGILGLVIGLGAQSLISDILAGLFIVFENCFQVGDIVSVDTFRGEVDDIGLRTTHIKNLDGDVLIINNSELRRYTNQSQHSSFAICDVTIEYGENLEKVEKIISENIIDIAERLKQITEGPIYRGVEGFTERGVKLRIVARCEEANRVQLNRDLSREIKILFDRQKIKIALPKIAVTKQS